ncbi:hypothetical protein OIU77_024555 [Salix suchowensis]|uniref:Uncharacterized protein n=1 Tax=Salix suchowensis TaxID=1278906 RepID=A0ABQ9BX69_9ROSI|nr:hypothetical protein OIU77_024555 [Salix suchowensis]
MGKYRAPEYNFFLKEKKPFFFFTFFNFILFRLLF